MTNTFIKPEVVIATSLGLLQREITLPATVWLNGLGDFAGAKDDTISIRVPGKIDAKRRSLRATGDDRNIVMGSIAETKVDVTLTDDVYTAVPITDEELSLDIKDFGAQILQPQMQGVAIDLEDGLVETMADADYSFVDENGNTGTVIIDSTKTYDSFVDARKVLNDRNVPFTNRYAVVGSGIEAAILKDPNFAQADRSGDSSALRDAVIGRIAGFSVMVSNALEPDEGYVYHKTAFAMVTRAPLVPQGATAGASSAFAGLSLRWLRDYDFITTTDRSLVDAYVGYKAVTEGDGSFRRAVNLQLGTATITVSPASKTLAAGGTQKLTVKDANSVTLRNSDVAFTSSDATKATVDTAGVVTAVATGSATITATYQGKTATCAVTVS